jgi:hypothetical protein
MSVHVPNEEPRERKHLLETLGDQVDRAVTVCTRYQHNWGATPRLWAAAHDKSGRSLCLTAAELITANLRPGDTAIISSGWVMQPYCSLGEYDGYIGSATLARAMSVGLGVKTLIVTDDACVEPFRKVLHAAEMRVWDLESFFTLPAFRSTCVVGFPTDRTAAARASVELLEKTGARVLIAIERSDENENGVHHTGSGRDMSAWTAKVQYLFKEARARRLPTIGVIDVGNEIGGAYLRDSVPKIVEPAVCVCPCKGTIAGATETSIAVVGRSSNAGAYGISACIAGILGRPEVLHDRGLQRRLMEFLITIPLADGPTQVSSFTEDGAPAELTLNLLDLLHWLVNCSMARSGG